MAADLRNFVLLRRGPRAGRRMPMLFGFGSGFGFQLSSWRPCLRRAWCSWVPVEE